MLHNDFVYYKILIALENIHNTKLVYLKIKEEI